jgi:hypothetical protein
MRRQRGNERAAGRWARFWIAATGLVAFGCGGSTDQDKPRSPSSAGSGGESDAGFFNPEPRDASTAPPMRRMPMPNPEAFWADDPPPMACLADGSMGPPPTPPGGTPECPDDKNREGCPCSTMDERAPCWPGLRVNRNRGICRDGMTTCEPFEEFGGAWGPCEGYVLPAVGATTGAAACRCFSSGRWEIENLSPCFITYPDGSTYAVSTSVQAEGMASCPANPGGPPPSPDPGLNWSADRLTVDCAGRFELCYTIKAGDAMAASASDCVLARTCVEDWYEEAGVTQELPPLPPWVSNDPSCAQRFQQMGGYGEMSVRGLSIECDPIDDGSGEEYVFNRVTYCPATCDQMPTAPECMNCQMGGSGDF